jgi:putative FmdB family regulatory protein
MNQLTAESYLIMPLYEYQCDACSTRFERIQKFSDPPIDVCPSCGGTVKKLLSSPAIQFKGSGWYITDYARKSSGAPDAAKPAAESPAASKAESAASSGGAGSSSGSSSPGSSKKAGEP